jgi:hypothetical protein
MERVVKDETDRKLLLTFIQRHKLPFVVTIVKGKPRTVKQNKLQRKWLNEIAEQLGDRTAEEVRGEVKLRFGVPILRAEDEVFCEKYDRLIKHLPYSTKIEFMMEPIDFPITRLMDTSQKTRYLDSIFKFYTEHGLKLTEPESER